MAKLAVGDITGMATAILDKYRKNAITDLCTDVQKHTALSSLMKKSRMAWDGGEQFTFVYQGSTNGSARVTGLFDDDSIVVTDDIGTGRIPIKHFTCNTAFDKKESVFNQGAARIVDHIKLRKRAAIGDMHKYMETALWTALSASTDDGLWGLPMAITYPTTYSARGFVGGNPSGWTSGYAGISSTSVYRWANYFDEYTEKNYDDLGLKWIRAALECDFTPIVPYAGARTRGGYGYYTNQDMLVELYRVIRSQNDNWGQAIDAGAAGDPLFRRVPVNYVRILDDAKTADTDTRAEMGAYDPIYGINWSTFKIFFFKSEWMALTVKPSATKHGVTECHWDLSANVGCVNRRPNFLLAHSDLC